jgi:hypothetical protein
MTYYGRHRHFGGARKSTSAPNLEGYVDLTEAQLGYIMGSALLLGIVLGWPALTTALALNMPRTRTMKDR